MMREREDVQQRLIMSWASRIEVKEREAKEGNVLRNEAEVRVFKG
jgi:hypothetical protein